MVSVWLVTTGFVIATFVTTKMRGYKKMPPALRDAIAADAIFGALLLLRMLLMLLFSVPNAGCGCKSFR
jgi:hypothetical protein